MILHSEWRDDYRPSRLDAAIDRGFDPGECRDCHTALHEPATYCLECARDRQALADERNAEWWS